MSNTNDAILDDVAAALGAPPIPRPSSSPHENLPKVAEATAESLDLLRRYHEQVDAALGEAVECMHAAAKTYQKDKPRTHRKYLRMATELRERQKKMRLVVVAVDQMIQQAKRG